MYNNNNKISIMKRNMFFITALISMLMLGMTACDKDDTDAPYFTLVIDGQTYESASLILNTDAHTQVFSVKSNGSWKIIPKGESTSWATISPDHGENDGSFTLSVERNIYTVDRSMELAFQVNNNELKSIYVLQSAFGPELRITTDLDPTIIKEGDIITFDISTNADSWEYSKTSDWLTEVEKNATILKLKVAESLSAKMVDTVKFTIPDYPSVVREIVVKRQVPLTGITLSKQEIDLIIGDGEEIIVATPVPANATDVDFVWTSGNPAIATVSSTGTITAISYGTTTITVSSNGIETTLTVNVKLPIISGVYTVLSSSWIMDDEGGLYYGYPGDGQITITETETPGEYEFSDLYGGCSDAGAAPGIIKFDGYDFSLIEAEDPEGYGFWGVYGWYDNTTKTIYLDIDWAGYMIYLDLEKNP
jgi:uncharacterized protein YjdB